MDAKIILVDDEPIVTNVMERYAEKGDLPSNSPRGMARPINYVTLMAFRDTLIGRHVSPKPTLEECREALRAFATDPLAHLLPVPAAG